MSTAHLTISLKLNMATIEKKLKNDINTDKILLLFNFTEIQRKPQQQKFFIQISHYII